MFIWRKWCKVVVFIPLASVSPTCFTMKQPNGINLSSKMQPYSSGIAEAHRGRCCRRTCRIGPTSWKMGEGSVKELGGWKFNWAMSKTLIVFGDLLGIILPSYVGIIINHYKDPSWTTSMMGSKWVFVVAQRRQLEANGVQLRSSQRLGQWVATTE